MEIKIMSNAIDYINSLHRNPHILSPLLEVFYKNLTIKKNNILLSYLVYPLILSPTSMTKLKNSNITSTLYTIFRDKRLIAGVQERVEAYKTITNNSLQIAFQAKSMAVSDEQAVIYLENKIENLSCSKDMVRATKNLAILFSSYEIVDCYRVLGVRVL
jgi:hypothetical protein